MEIVGDFEYNSKDLIGHGAFAVVFKGRHRKKPGYMVAIKSITKKSLAKSQNLLGKEIKILKELTELHHENVVALLDCKESQNNVFLVMEFCSGGDLGDYLVAKGTLSEDTIRIFLGQLAGAMNALYTKGIVHRDLKPQNILLSHSYGKSYPQPSLITLKIADFGFARFLQDGNMAATLCGSPMYMAPEVIMSLQYDAKADLWSLGTIVFQCLTGKAPFQAHTPQELKMFYEQNCNLAPKIPVGTSPELSHLLIGLLKRNSKDRMEFDEFFSHPFLAPTTPQSPVFTDNMSQTPKTQSPIQQQVGNPQEPSDPIDVISATLTNPGILGDKSIPSSSSSPDNSDDFVHVPMNLPVDQNVVNYERKHSTTRMQVTNPQASPPRPSTLPISEPRPVPTPARRLSQTQDKIKQQQQNLSSSPKNISTVPRSQPINLKRSDHRSSVNSDTITPPAVQFAIGTPPGGGSSGRVRSTSGGSLSETPPPRWNVSPNAHQSPLRRSGNSSPVLPSALLPALGSPTLWIPPDNNNHPHILGPRAFTLPEIGATGGLQSLLDTNNSEDQTLEFHAPELPAETLLDREHNETLAKLNFVLALTDCIIEVANLRCSPISAMMAAIPPHSKDHCKRSERLVLLVRALQLLSSGLNLAAQQFHAGTLQPSTTVKKVLSRMNAQYRATLAESKKLNGSGLLQKANQAYVTADKLLYRHAMECCENAALDELFGNPRESFALYQTAQILLHSLGQRCNHQQDKILLAKYKDAVEKRLYILQQAGHIISLSQEDSTSMDKS